jgi:hypothetical protein
MGMGIHELLAVPENRAYFKVVMSGRSWQAGVAAEADAAGFRQALNFGGPANLVEGFRPAAGALFRLLAIEASHWRDSMLSFFHHGRVSLKWK